MPCWYYDAKAFHKTPSIQDGIDYETECKYRKEGARFIMDIGTQMDLGCNTMATGVVFFHRFYMFHSFMEFPRFVTACCCIFLAGKVEETPKKCRDIIKIAQSLLNEEAFSSFGEDPKEEVMTLEKILLQTIKFDLKVQHPYSYLIKYAKHLKGDKNKLHKMVQMAWTFINDSLCTTLCLQWEPEIIAIALMYLASKLSKFEVVSWVCRKRYQTKWWDLFVEDLPKSTLEDICHEVLDLYSTVKDTIQESKQVVTKTIKNDPEIKNENPIKLEETGSQQIAIKTEESNLHQDSKKIKEVNSNTTSIKLEPCIDSTLPVSCIKKQPESSQVENSQPKIHLYVAKWASVDASAVMSPGTSSVNSPSFPTPKFLVSPVSIGSFNTHFNESPNHQNLNFNNNLPSNFNEHKNCSATSFNKQNSNNFNDVTSSVSQDYTFNKLRNNMPSDNCSVNLPINSLELDSYNDNIPFRSRGFGNLNDNDNASFRSRGFTDINENAMNNNHNFDYFSKNYRNCDIFDYPGSRNFYNEVQYSKKMRNDKDRRSNSYNYPYPELKNGFCTDLYPESNDFYIDKTNKNSRRSKSKRSGGRFKNSRNFDGPKNNNY